MFSACVSNSRLLGNGRVIVVKVGGSLFDHPRLGPGVAGVSRFARAGGSDARSRRRRRGGSGAGARPRSRAGRRGVALAGDVGVGRRGGVSVARARPVSDSRVTVLDCFQFALDDESRPGKLPHSWDVTSDQPRGSRRGRVRGRTAGAAQVGRCAAGNAVGRSRGARVGRSALPEGASRDAASRSRS